MKDLVVCKFKGCNKVFNDPRFLPCGKRTCAAHIDTMLVKSGDTPMIKCHFCKEIHAIPESSGKGFPVDENISLLLDMKHCKEHSAAKKSFNELTQLLDKLTKLDKEGFVIDYFERVETDILLDKEANMQKLTAHYGYLLDEVHERKVACLQHVKANKQLASELEAINRTLVEHKSKLSKDNLDFIIKTLDGDEDKWKSIQAECNDTAKRVKSLEDELKKKILCDHMILFKPRSACDSRVAESLCGILDDRSIDSTILSSYKMKKDLVKLCKLSGKQFQLLYRASRDGFQAANFHAKCNNYTRTLTVVQTTKGYVFGGYTSVAWDSTSCFKADPNAFLFSLLNQRATPLLMPAMADDKCSIYCNFAYCPTFGASNSIHIANNSNTTTESYSNLGKSFHFKLFEYGSNEALSFLAGSRNFQTTEVEVFQLN